MSFQQFVIGTLVITNLALAVLSYRTEARVTASEQHQEMLAHWAYLQKVRADQIECLLANPFNRVPCEGLEVSQ